MCRLHLLHNVIGNEGLVAFAKALQQNTILETLNMDANKNISDQGILVMVHALSHMNGLEHLSLRGMGCMEMSTWEAFQQNMVLEWLSIYPSTKY